MLADYSKLGSCLKHRCWGLVDVDDDTYEYSNPRYCDGTPFSFTDVKWPKFVSYSDCLSHCSDKGKVRTYPFLYLGPNMFVIQLSQTEDFRSTPYDALIGKLNTYCVEKVIGKDFGDYLAILELPAGEELPSPLEIPVSKKLRIKINSTRVVAFDPYAVNPESNFCKSLRQLECGECAQLVRFAKERYGYQEKRASASPRHAPVSRADSDNVIRDLKKIPSNIRDLLATLRPDAVARPVVDARSGDYGIIDPYGFVFSFHGRYQGQLIVPSFNQGKYYVKLMTEAGRPKKFLVGFLLENARKSKRFLNDED